jgi:hypothetical protein
MTERVYLGRLLRRVGRTWIGSLGQDVPTAGRYTGELRCSGGDPGDRTSSVLLSWAVG